ncbi:hypothetical protein DRO30_03710 [Candidatus Bathyarchaeota archaeon]|nr:MAG: hypothetical protein DRO30_03710 [Candidatus Bathyarchaeota archaeon]
MSFQDISITIRAVNRASTEFARVSADAENMRARIRAAASAIAGLGSASIAVAHLGRIFGLLDEQTSRYLASLGSVITVLGAFLRTSWGMAVAQKIYAAACWVATAAQNALNISYATFLALTGVGIGVIVAAAAAMWYFANQMNAATRAVKEYGAAASEIPAYTRSIRRAGEEEALRRRGIE